MAKPGGGCVVCAAMAGTTPAGAPTELPRTERARATVWKKLAWALGATCALAWLGVELLSRRADGVVAERRATPGYRFDAAQADLWDKWALPTLDPLGSALADARVAPHPFLGYALKPGWQSKPGERYQASHNALGLRGKEVARAKAPGTLRIVTLGGSSVYGSQDSRDDSVWSERLEQLLAAALPGRRVEVLNGGCLGYNSFEMLVNFEFRLLELAPDLVLTYEAINDMKAALYTRGGAVASDNTHYRNAWQAEVPGPVEEFCSASRAYLIWRRYFTDAGARRVDLYAYIQRNYGVPGEGAWYCQWPDDQVPEQGFANYRRNLNSLISVADAAGVKVVLATQALVRRHMEREECRDTQLEAFDRIQSVEREVAAERAVALCDVGPRIVEEVERRWAASTHAHDGAPVPDVPDHVHCRPFGEGRFRREWFHNDVHPYDHGSEVVARHVAEWLLASPLLAR